MWLPPRSACEWLEPRQTAGDGSKAPLSHGEAMRIMTGALMPPGADAVCMVERTRAEDGGLAVVIEESVSRGTNVREPGEDIAAGAEVFTPGMRLSPAHIGVLASLGIQELLVCPRPAVGVLSTGDELAAPDAVLLPGKIRDANRPALLAQLGSDGFRQVDLGTVGDDQDMLADRLRTAASRCDAIIATGGVSVGDHDLLKVALEKLGGATMHSLEIAMRPGKHVAVASLGEQRIPAFGLPGNPVAALLPMSCWSAGATGHGPLPGARPATACRDSGNRPASPARARTPPDAGDSTDRADGVPRVRPSGGQQSHMLMAMARANALALLPDGDGVGPAGVSRCCYSIPTGSSSPARDGRRPRAALPTGGVIWATNLIAFGLCTGTWIAVAPPPAHTIRRRTRRSSSRRCCTPIRRRPPGCRSSPTAGRCHSGPPPPSAHRHLAIKRWAKLLMMIEAGVSVSIGVLVIAQRDRHLEVAAGIRPAGGSYTCPAPGRVLPRGPQFPHKSAAWGVPPQEAHRRNGTMRYLTARSL